MWTAEVRHKGDSGQASFISWSRRFLNFRSYIPPPQQDVLWFCFYYSLQDASHAWTVSHPSHTMVSKYGSGTSCIYVVHFAFIKISVVREDCFKLYSVTLNYPEKISYSPLCVYQNAVWTKTHTTNCHSNRKNPLLPLMAAWQIHLLNVELWSIINRQS